MTITCLTWACWSKSWEWKKNKWNPDLEKQKKGSLWGVDQISFGGSNKNEMGDFSPSPFSAKSK